MAFMLSACSTYENTNSTPKTESDPTGMRQVDAQGNIIGGGVNISEDDTTVIVTNGHRITVTDVSTGDTIIKPLPGFGEDSSDFKNK